MKSSQSVFTSVFLEFTGTRTAHATCYLYFLQLCFSIKCVPIPKKSHQFATRPTKGPRRSMNTFNLSKCFRQNLPFFLKKCLGRNVNTVHISGLRFASCIPLIASTLQKCSLSVPSDFKFDFQTLIVNFSCTLRQYQFTVEGRGSAKIRK